MKRTTRSNPRRATEAVWEKSVTATNPNTATASTSRTVPTNHRASHRLSAAPSRQQRSTYPHMRKPWDPSLSSSGLLRAHGRTCDRSGTVRELVHTPYPRPHLKDAGIPEGSAVYYALGRSTYLNSDLEELLVPDRATDPPLCRNSQLIEQCGEIQSLQVQSLQIGGFETTCIVGNCYSLQEGVGV